MNAIYRIRAANFGCLIFLVLLAGCMSGNNAQPDSAGMDTSISWENAAVTLPSPDSVQLGPGGRFYSRYQGNVNYLKYQHAHFGEEMLKAFAARNYSPGKLLERMWDGEYAGKWLDAATRTAVNTDDRQLLSMVDQFAEALRQYQRPVSYTHLRAHET